MSKVINYWGFGVTDTIEPRIPKIVNRFNKYTIYGDFPSDVGFNPILHTKNKTKNERNKI